MSAKSDKCIITAALAGAATLKQQNPSVPYTRDEFVSEAVKCYENGAAIVHIHARDPESGMPTADLDILGAIVEGISCLLYTSDAADDLLCVDLGGRRI